VSSVNVVSVLTTFNERGPRNPTFVLDGKLGYASHLAVPLVGLDFLLDSFRRQHSAGHLYRGASAAAVGCSKPACSLSQ
jgi:hypothetical protein